jgi:hypothetical protein
MSDKKIRIKVSELRALVREAMGEASTVTSRQTLMSAADEPEVEDMLGKSDITEFRSFDDDFAEKFSDRKYEEMARELYNAWSQRGVDVDWAGVVNLYARNHSKNLAMDIDKSKLYEKVLTFVERDFDALDRGKNG